MIETALIASFSLLLITLGIIFIYFRKIREIRDKYVEAKNILSDIILSFKQDLRQHEDRIQSVSEKVESLPSRDEELKKIDALRAEVTLVKNDLNETSDSTRTLSARVETLSKRIEDLSLQQEERLKTLSELEETRRNEPFMSDNIEAAIPIRRERAISRLTETELKVLEILASEGEKSASQIRNRINMTREHTTRLMKTLYARGYVERTTEKLPYMYRVKDEMMKILKKVE